VTPAPPPPAHARVWAEVDLEAVRANVRTILATADVPLLAVVKADAYGHGAVEVGRAALEAGARGLGVATAAEAWELRQAGIGAPIQVLGSFLPGDELDLAVRAGATLTLHDAEDLERVRAAAWRARRRLPVELKVDVGMHRHGVALPQAAALLRRVRAEGTVRLDGLMTHLPCAAGSDLAATRVRAAAFGAFAEAARQRGLAPARVHAAASAALFRVPESRLTQVRAGIAVVGLDPTGCLAEVGVRLRPALALRARVMRVRAVPRGAAVGYGGTWVASRPSRVAIVGAGYADGVPYPLSGRGGRVLIQGRPCPLVGTVMMDYCLVDVTDLPRLPQPGDVCTLAGADGFARIGVEELAAQAGLIPYALTCGLGRRVGRVVRGARASAPAPVLRVA